METAVLGSETRHFNGKLFYRYSFFRDLRAAKSSITSLRSNGFSGRVTSRSKRTLAGSFRYTVWFRCNGTPKGNQLRESSDKKLAERLESLCGKNCESCQLRYQKCH